MQAARPCLATVLISSGGLTVDRPSASAPRASTLRLA